MRESCFLKIFFASRLFQRCRYSPSPLLSLPWGLRLDALPRRFSYTALPLSYTSIREALARRSSAPMPRSKHRGSRAWSLASSRSELRRSPPALSAPLHQRLWLSRAGRWSTRYFTATTFATIGFGDLKPVRPAGRLLTSMCGVAGVGEPRLRRSLSCLAHSAQPILPATRSTRRAGERDSGSVARGVRGGGGW